VFGYYRFGLFTAYNSYTAQRDLKKGEVKILIYGELFPDEEIENKIAQTFGFRFDRVDDCTINQVLINGVESYNRKVKKHLRKLNGDKWEIKFDEQLLKETKNNEN
jgi:hypothetical protein